MIPAAFVPLSSFPLTPSGKVNRKALPPPDGTAFEADVASLAPRNPTEEIIARLWCDVLNLKKVGVRDNFFELGGNSLLAVRVIFRINAALRTKLGVSAMFLMPTIEALAASIERNRQAGNRGPQVISFQTGHTGPPLYFINAGPAEYRIAQSIGEHRAIFAIDVPMPADWLHAIMAADRPLPTMEQLAALYGDAVRAHAGSSPCVVVGYSFSGKIAFEAARVLQHAGGNVAVVLLIDTFAWGGAPGMRTYAWQSLLRIWRGAAGGTAKHTSYIGRLSTSLVNSWRLMWWVIAQIPGLMKQRAAGRQEPAPLSGSWIQRACRSSGRSRSDCIASFRSHFTRARSMHRACCFARPFRVRIRCPATILPMDGATYSRGGSMSFTREEITRQSCATSST